MENKPWVDYHEWKALRDWRDDMEYVMSNPWVTKLNFGDKVKFRSRETDWVFIVDIDYNNGLSINGIDRNLKDIVSCQKKVK